MEKIRRYFIFNGRVQGVGFRYRASYAARGLGLTGWVKNNWDGSVEMEAQGTETQIQQMLIMLNKDSYIRIDRVEAKELPLKEDEHGFHVRGY